MSEASPGDSHNQHRAHQRPIRILHVDDETGFLDLAADALEREHDGFEVETATTAQQGLELLEEGNIDCVVSDYRMPDTDGLEFLASVRDSHPTLPFILFTGEGSEEVATLAFRVGASGYHQKSGGLEQFVVLANRITTLVDRRRIDRRRRRLETAIETARDGIAIIDDDGCFRYLNDSYAALYGYEIADLLGEGWERLYPAREADRYEREVVPALEEEGGWTGECLAVRADGTQFRSTHSLTQLPGGSHVCVIHAGSVIEDDR